eukprot:3917245-Amphidinium_carterae.1
MKKVEDTTGAQVSQLKIALNKPGMVCAGIPNSTEIGRIFLSLRSSSSTTRFLQRLCEEDC